MRSGRLRHKITIEEVSESRDSYGAPTETWSTLVERWASIEPVGGREYFSAKQENSEVSHRIRLRWERALVAVTTKHRVTYTYPILEESPQRLQSRVFDIEAVINTDERNKELVLMCREIL